MTNTLSESKPAVADGIPAHVYARSLRAVLLYNFAETFDLVDEEVVWVGYQLDSVAEILGEMSPESPTLCMRQEAQNRTYTNLLNIRTKAHVPRGNVAHSGKTTTPTLSHWVDAFAQPLENTYSELSGRDSLKIRQVISHILRNIGVGDPEMPRGCTRLPLELKMLLAEEKYALAYAANSEN